MAKANRTSAEKKNTCDASGRTSTGEDIMEKPPELVERDQRLEYFRGRAKQ